MEKDAVLRLPDAIVRHPSLCDAAVAAPVEIRPMAIKRYLPRNRRRELLLRGYLRNYVGVRNQIYREKGDGDRPTIVIGGFVPDATESVEFQRELFRSFGSIYYLNYARHGFSLAMFHAQLADLVEDLNRRGQQPVIFSVSFGCGLVRDFLERTEPEGTLRIGGLVMISPVLCMEDLVRTERRDGAGVRMLESSLRRILRLDSRESGDIERQMEGARRCFQALSETGAANRPLDNRHFSLRRRIMDLQALTPAQGGYERTVALRGLQPVSTERPLFGGRTLALIAEGEESILVPSSPTLAILYHRRSSSQVFPRGEVLRVKSTERDDPVVHASLIFHYQFYNPLIEAWYKRLRHPLLVPAVEG